MSDTQNTFEKFDKPEILFDVYVEKQSGDADLKRELLATIEDEEFVEAVKVAVKNQKASTSLLQRNLMIGYGKAAMYIDAMEALGLIGGPNEMLPREVFADAEAYLEYKSKMQLSWFMKEKKLVT